MSGSFVLRRIVWTDASYSRDSEDYSVLSDGLAVGRIYGNTLPQGKGYRWFIYGSSSSGFAETLEKARDAWKKSYLRVS